MVCYGFECGDLFARFCFSVVHPRLYGKLISFLRDFFTILLMPPNSDKCPLLVSVIPSRFDKRYSTYQSSFSFELFFLDIHLFDKIFFAFTRGHFVLA
ncbi:hypothetical protein ACMFMF_004903 [Clarireedia jacksonii]